MKNTKIIPGYKTDHSAIVFTFSASLDKRGKGYWKFNSQLLRDTAYVEKVKMCIKDTLSSEFYLSDSIDVPFQVQFTCNDQFFLEVLKMKIRSLSITHSIFKSKEEKKTTLKLEEDIQNLDVIMNTAPTEAVQTTLNDKKVELEFMREQKIEGLLLRSRTNWHENGEKCSQYFCKVEKRNFIKKTMVEMIGDQVSLSIVPDPCLDIQPSTQVTDMCQAGLAVEQISESNDGNLKFDHVTLRARKQEDNCICLVFIENQSLNSFQIYIQPYEKLQSSAPKEPKCGMELYLEVYDIETLQQNQITDPIKCTSGQNDLHVNGQNGTLKIVCDVPGRIPSMNFTTTQSPDHLTGHPLSSSSSSTRKADHQDVLEGDYHTVDNDQPPINKKVSEHDINYSTVDDNVARTSLNTVPTHGVVKHSHKGPGYDNLEVKENTTREPNISHEGNGLNDGIPNPCPVGMNSPVADMCMSSFAIEKDGNGPEFLDSVVLRAMVDRGGCTCDILIENHIVKTKIFIEKYENISAAAPKNTVCGLAIDIEMLNDESVFYQIECTNDVDRRPFSIVKNGVLRFTSRIIQGNFTRGYCINIIRGGYTIVLYYSCKYVRCH
ncbi:unnamed protein product [Mytilus coruscus]|uniref:Uncharacterized protein n=1 Tax=Mytilus coruscus TaxID=42192 RepID=A0A6J8AEV3_MYTCO|nr:unnamed protein product [Mytilus coruscus]